VYIYSNCIVSLLIKYYINFMVISHINNIQHFNFHLMHTTLKNTVIKTFLK